MSIMCITGLRQKNVLKKCRKNYNCVQGMLSSKLCRSLSSWQLSTFRPFFARCNRLMSKICPTLNCPMHPTTPDRNSDTGKCSISSEPPKRWEKNDVIKFEIMYIKDEVVRLRTGLILCIKFLPLQNPFQACSQRNISINTARVKVLFIWMYFLFVIKLMTRLLLIEFFNSVYFRLICKRVFLINYC